MTRCHFIKGSDGHPTPRAKRNDAVVGNLSGMHPGAFLSPQNAGAPRQGAPASSKPNHEA